MTFSKSAKTFLGIAAVSPLAAYGLLGAALTSGAADESPLVTSVDALGFTFAGILLLLLTAVATFLVILFRNPTVPPPMKAVWAILLFLGGIVVMRVFWYLYIWREAKPVQPTPLAVTFAAGEGDRRFKIAAAGSAVLFVGVFLPAVQIPIVGSQNLLQNDGGALLIVLAVISLLLAFAHRYRGLLITGGFSLFMLIVMFLNFQNRIREMRAQMSRDLSGNPFRGLAEGMMQGVQIQWGWAVLVVGAVLLLIAGATQHHPVATSAPANSA